MIIEGREYITVMGSDVGRDGMFLELRLADRAEAPLAECFYSDRDGSLRLTEYAAGVSAAALEWLSIEGGQRLPPTIHPESYRTDLNRTLDDVGLRSYSLEFVDSVREWANAVGISELRDPLAMALLANGKPLIVFKSVITPDDRSAVAGRLIIGGFDEELHRIQLPEAFLEHLVLHEAAHLILPDGSNEEACDQWAFEQLRSRIERRTA